MLEKEEIALLRQCVYVFSQPTHFVGEREDMKHGEISLSC